jgi:hypothetical protein
MIDNLVIKKNNGQIEISGYLGTYKEVEIEISRDWSDDVAFYATKSEAAQIIQHLKRLFEL